MARLHGVGVLGPGLADWAATRAVLAGLAAYAEAATSVPNPARLPAAERRRAGTAIKIALAAAEQACADAAIDPGLLGSVFCTSTGDGANCHALCETLAGADRLVSPTRFTNSVHNAAAGYWHIAAGNQAASTTVCAFDASFGAGLIEALIQLQATGSPLLLVASDTPYPEPLHATRPLPGSFAVALVLSPDQGNEQHPGASISAELLGADESGPATACGDAALEALRQSIPAARALPLLEALAKGSTDPVVLDFQRGLRLRVRLLAS